jgi:protein-export chaperone SecB
MADFKLISQFMKSFDFNSPSVPELFFRQENNPAKIDVDIDLQIKSSENKLYMVDLLTKLNSKLETEDKIVFSINSVFSALVQIEKDMSEEELKHVLLVDVPTQIFPSVRAMVLMASGESGFSPLQMQVVDFEDQYNKTQKA